MTSKFHFSDSNRTARHAEARRNASEALSHLQRWLPKALDVKEPEPEPMAPERVKTAAGQCFQRVSAILAGRGK